MNFSPSDSAALHRIHRRLPLSARLVWLAAVFLIVFGDARVASAADTTAPGWSADLLGQILKAETRKAEIPPTPAADVVLHTYQLAHLRIGEAGKTQNVLAILEKLLPPGSSIKSDVPANSIHVLTTPAAHKAVWDYLSAVDIPDPAPAATSVMPEEVKAALQQLANSRADSAKLLAAVGAVKADVSRELTVIDTQRRRDWSRFAWSGALFMVGLVVFAGWMLRRGASVESSDATPEHAVALVPDQLASALVPVQDRMRNEMLGVLNEVAIKLQAQHNEQQKLVREQQQQLDNARQALADERRQFVSEAGHMVVQAVERVDATTAKLARQQDKVAELVQELQHTVRELDETKDSLRDREVELEQERAKIAALSLLLEEGGPLPSADAPAPRRFLSDRNGSNPHPNGAAPRSSPNSSCLTTDASPPPSTPMTLPVNGQRPTPTSPRFTFVPPDHPES